MKQIRLYGPHDLRMDDVPVPVAGPRDAVVKVDIFGICGTDIGYARNGYIGRPNGRAMPIGHELAGTIASLGDDVTDLEVGQRVVVHPMKGPNRIGTGDDDHGGFAEYLLVRDARRDHSIFPIADSLPLERAVLTEPISVGMHGINFGDIRPGEQAVVLGAGPIGLGTIAALKYRGARTVAVLDVVDDRLERAKALGADIVVNTRTGDVAAALAAGLGSFTQPLLGNVVVDCDLFVDCAGHGPLFQQMVALAKNEARLVILATHKEPVTLDFVQVMVKELAIKGSLSYPNEFPEVLAMLSSGAVDMTPMVSHVYTFDRFGEAFAMACNAGQSAKVLVTL